ncbi:MAG: hypothetical protein FWE93_02595 [Alphaproteobacteria bacterium]|nr:hypothetical protein [Alphaproteobacteria bacterium]
MKAFDAEAVTCPSLTKVSLNSLIRRSLSARRSAFTSKVFPLRSAL